jgi:hypothetical protein
MNNTPTLIVGITVIVVDGFTAAAAAALPVVAAIKWKRIMSARQRRRASTRWRQGLVLSHPSYSSSSVAAEAVAIPL